MASQPAGHPRFDLHGLDHMLDIRNRAAIDQHLVGRLPGKITVQEMRHPARIDEVVFQLDWHAILAVH